MSEPSLPLDHLLARAIEWVHGASRILLAHFSASDKDIQHKGAIDLVTRADRESEAFLIDRIETEFPDHGYVAEEGHRKSVAGGLAWYIDPLDGTTNFAHGYPVFCISIALVWRGRAVLGVVHDPTRHETFTAIRGQGAKRNGQPIRASQQNLLRNALLCSGFPYSFAEDARNLRLWDAFLHAAQSVRRDGSAALDLCYVAAGRFDGFWELGLHSWDIAAGTLVATEAGALATQFDGSELDLDARNILVANPVLHAAMQRILQANGAY